jgi:ATP-dependent DNA helicase RecQ
VAADADARHRMDESRVEMMRDYAETRACRRHVLLGYFGQEAPPRCDGCDNCRAGRAEAPPEDSATLPAGTRVQHSTWGPGEVLRHDGDRIVAVFEEVGYRTLSEQLVTENELLEEI